MFVTYFVSAADFCLEVRSVGVCVATSTSFFARRGRAESSLDTVCEQFRRWWFPLPYLHLFNYARTCSVEQLHSQPSAEYRYVYTIRFSGRSTLAAHTQGWPKALGLPWAWAHHPHRQVRSATARCAGKPGLLGGQDKQWQLRWKAENACVSQTSIIKAASQACPSLHTPMPSLVLLF